MRWAILATAAVVLVGATILASAAHEARAQGDGIDLKSNVSYTLRPDEGALRVSWDITIANNDPETSASGSGGVIRFYEGFSFPVLSGARNLTASSSGTPLSVSTSPVEDAPIDQAAVTLASPLYYGQTLSMQMSYDIAEVREPSLQITPTYVVVPILALGDTSTVTVALPATPWVAELVPAECAQAQSTFNCSGSDDIYVAALAEASRPDLTVTTATDLPLGGKTVKLSIKHFQGEEAFGQHVKDLAVNALPVIQDLYGIPYSGPVEERGKVVTTGYEGIAECGDSFCTIAVTPIADDYIILHELAHLWSGHYSNRWLQEGFAELVAKEAAGRLASGLVRGEPVERTPATVDLQLDQWGAITPGASLVGPERDIETAGYYRAERFLALLQSEVGFDALRKANIAIGSTGAADSKRFMDALEDAGGGNNDDLFMEWVFDDSLAPAVSERRQARDRFSRVVARATAEGISDTVTQRVWNDLSAWKFEDAQARLDEADDLLADYEDMKGDLAVFRSAAEAAGLSVGPPVEEDLNEWHFKAAAEKIDRAMLALAAYEEAKIKVDEPRNTWEEFGLMGSDPKGSVRDAAAAFNAGDYEQAADEAADAISAVAGASDTAKRRVLVVAGAAAAAAMLVLLGVWYTQLRDRRAGRFG
jgi:hypothetical protein